MKPLALFLAVVGLTVSTAALADHDWPLPRLPGIEIRPHPAPTAPDYSTCLLKCADREDACLHGERRRLGPRECRLQRSLCDSDCIRYGINER